MEFGVIKEIGTSFLVGAMALLFFEGFVYFSSGWTLTGFFKLPLGFGPTSDSKQDKASDAASQSEANNTVAASDIHAGVFVAGSIIVGLTILAISYRPVDYAAKPLRAISVPIFSLIQNPEIRRDWGLESVGTLEDLRLNVVWSQDSETELTPIGQELIAFQIPSRYCESSTGNRMHSAAPGSEARLLLDESCGLRLFYTAKNWVYLQPTLFEEMASLEARIHFFGAISLSCVLLLPLGLSFLGAGLFYALQKSGRGRACLAALTLCAAALIWFLNWPYEKPAIFLDIVTAIVAALACTAVAEFLLRTVHERVPVEKRPDYRAVIRRVVPIFAIVLVSHLAAYLAYSREQDEFGRRVYGYFSSAHVLQDELGGEKSD